MGSLATRSLVLLCEPNSLEKITNHALQESRPCSDNDHNHNEIDLAGSSDMDGNSVFPQAASSNGGMQQEEDPEEAGEEYETRGGAVAQVRVTNRRC